MWSVHGAGAGESRSQWLAGVAIAVLGLTAPTGAAVYLANRSAGELLPGGPGTVTASRFNPITPASIDLSRQAGPTGSDLRVTGHGFRPDEDVELHFHTASLGRTRADASGTIAVTVAIPGGFSEFAPQRYDIVATGRTSLKSDRRAFELTG